MSAESGSFPPPSPGWLCGVAASSRKGGLRLPLIGYQCVIPGQADTIHDTVCITVCHLPPLTRLAVRRGSVHQEGVVAGLAQLHHEVLHGARGAPGSSHSGAVAHQHGRVAQQQRPDEGTENQGLFSRSYVVMPPSVSFLEVKTRHKDIRNMHIPYHSPLDVHLIPAPPTCRFPSAWRSAPRAPAAPSWAAAASSRPSSAGGACAAAKGGGARTGGVVRAENGVKEGEYGTRLLGESTKSLQVVLILAALNPCPLHTVLQSTAPSPITLPTSCSTLCSCFRCRRTRHPRCTLSPAAHRRHPDAPPAARCAPPPAAPCRPPHPVPASRTAKRIVHVPSCALLRIQATPLPLIHPAPDNTNARNHPPSRPPHTPTPTRPSPHLQHAVQLRHLVVVAQVLEPPLEGRPAGELVWLQEVQQHEQLAQVVLERGAGQQHLVLHAVCGEGRSKQQKKQPAYVGLSE